MTLLATLPPKKNAASNITSSNYKFLLVSPISRHPKLHQAWWTLTLRGCPHCPHHRLWTLHLLCFPCWRHRWSRQPHQSAGLCSSRTACGPGESWGKARWFNPSRTEKCMIYDSIYDDLPKKSDDYLIVGVNLKMLVKWAWGIIPENTTCLKPPNHHVGIISNDLLFSHLSCEQFLVELGLLCIDSRVVLWDSMYFVTVKCAATPVLTWSQVVVFWKWSLQAKVAKHVQYIVLPQRGGWFWWCLDLTKLIWHHFFAIAVVNAILPALPEISMVQLFRNCLQHHMYSQEHLGAS